MTSHRATAAAAVLRSSPSSPPWATSKRGRVVAVLSPESEHDGPWTAAAGFVERTARALHRVDAAWSTSCWSAAPQWLPLRTLYLWLEYTGHGVPWLVGGLVWVVWLFVATPFQLDLFLNALTFFVGLLVDVAVVGGAKLAVRRARPPYNKGHIVATPSADRFSFPSGHTSRAAFVATFMIVRSMGAPWQQGAAVGWALVLATSRVLLGRHFIGDVVAGLLVGVAEYWLALVVMWLPTTEWWGWWFGAVNGFPVTFSDQLL